MVNRKVVALVAVGVSLFLVGGVAGAMFLADDGGSPDAAGDGNGDDPTPAPAPAAGTTTVAPTETATSTPVPTTATPTPTPVLTTATSTATQTATPTQTPTLTATPTPTPKPTPTATPTPTPTDSRTPIAVDPVDEAEIESELRRLFNDWRRDNGLDAFGQSEGNLVARLNEMAENHSLAMAEMGKTIHVSNNMTTEDRYHEFELYHTCNYDDDGFVRPDTKFEVLALSEVPDDESSDREQRIAADVFESITTNDVFSERLEVPQFDRIGIGIEISDDDRVWVTVDACSA